LNFTEAHWDGPSRKDQRPGTRTRLVCTRTFTIWIPWMDFRVLRPGSMIPALFWASYSRLALAWGFLVSHVAIWFPYLNFHLPFSIDKNTLTIVKNFTRPRHLDWVSYTRGAGRMPTMQRWYVPQQAQLNLCAVQINSLLSQKLSSGMSFAFVFLSRSCTCFLDFNDLKSQLSTETPTVVISTIDDREPNSVSTIEWF